MLNKIDQELYRLFSDKTLNFGCLVQLGENFKIIESQVNGSINETYTIVNMHYVSFERQCFKILGHEPQLHDVFREGEKKLENDFECSINMSRIVFFSRKKGTVEIPYNPTLPLLQQSDTTKQSIIDLFS